MQATINSVRDADSGVADEQFAFRQKGAAMRSDLAAAGIVALDRNSGLFSAHELDQLERLSATVELEIVVDGDSGDQHTLKVGRLLKAPPGQSPWAVSAATGEMLRVLSNPRLMGLLQGLLATDEPICYRRGQINVISANGFVGPHVDRDADPDYQLVLIFHLDSSYQGGEYVVEPSAGASPVGFKPEPSTTLIGRTDVNHWVERVTGGERRTLVMFASTYAGPNRKAAD